MQDEPKQDMTVSEESVSTDVTDDSQELAAPSVREQFVLSLVNATPAELSGGRRPSIRWGAMFSKLMWYMTVIGLLGIIIWQSAVIVSARIDYGRDDEYYQKLADRFSLSAGDSGLISMLYGDKAPFDVPDYEQMQSGNVVLDKNVLTNEEKKELSLYSTKLKELKKQNAQTIGWIYIPGTNIDYPVVKASAADPEFYVTHSFSGATSSLGALFVESHCGSVISQNKNTIIAGHNIRTKGLMFNQLLKFEDESFFQNNSTIYLYTDEGKFTFKIYSFFRADYQYNFRKVSFLSNKEFISYAEAMRNNSWYHRQGVILDEDDRILTLYTCTNENIKTNRYVMVAVLEDVLLHQ